MIKTKVRVHFKHLNSYYNSKNGSFFKKIFKNEVEADIDTYILITAMECKVITKYSL